MAFITIQSSSFRNRPVNFFGSVPRLADRVGRASAVDSLVLGRGVPSSRPPRSTSSIPLVSKSPFQNGGDPVSSSYSSAPRVHVAARVDVQIVERGLFRRHV